MIIFTFRSISNSVVQNIDSGQLSSRRTSIDLCLLSASVLPRSVSHRNASCVVFLEWLFLKFFELQSLSQNARTNRLINTVVRLRIININVTTRVWVPAIDNITVQEI